MSANCRQAECKLLHDLLFRDGPLSELMRSAGLSCWDFLQTLRPRAWSSASYTALQPSGSPTTVDHLLQAAEGAVLSPNAAENTKQTHHQQ